ncbi:MAG: aldo/keto reductase family protein [Deltaproteobacteria bacterium]|nr:aldo/keto reductase family protein [Deltaproteobacteria bacterium]
MQYVNLGNSGLKVSRVAIGSWLTYGSSVDKSGTAACIRAALDLGVIFVDTADVYARGAAEEVLGEVLAGGRREDIVLASKAFWPMSDNPNDRGLSRKHLMESCHASLRRLRTDYLDLYQCHRFDPETPVMETVRAMGDLIAQGKVLYWGVSCWEGEQIAQACSLSDQLGVPRPISNQPPYSLLQRHIEAEVVPESRRLGLSQVVFSPLAQGVLTGKYSGGARPSGSRGADESRNVFMGDDLQDDVLARVDTMVQIASDLGTTPARLALAWALRLDNVASVIVGATKVSQVEDNVAASELTLDDEVVSRLNELFPA